MKIRENITIYQCDFCGKKYLIEHFCKSHEEKCKKNPDNFRICHSCDNLEQIETEYYYDTFQGEGVRTVKVFHCKVKKEYLYPASVGHSEYGAYEFGDIENNPMKSECDEYTEYLPF